MREIDFLFIHPTTHYYSHDAPVKDLLTFVTMPLGTIAIADLIYRNGFSTKIFHTGIEQTYNRSFRVEEIFSEYAPAMVGIDLHWYVHSYDAIRIARIAKRHTNAYVVLGGFTASYFSREILKDHEYIDAVIEGDAEIPLLTLVETGPEKDLDEVPNLVYRKNKSVKTSKKKFIASAKDLGMLDYTNFDLLLNYDKYHRSINQSGDLGPYTFKTPIKKLAWIPLGRGCSVNCSYCGGGNDAHCRLTSRRKPLYHPMKQIVETLRRFELEGIDSTYMDFDPDTDRSFYHKLFNEIRKEKIDISTAFALWSPSNKKFVQDFSDTFNPVYTTLVLSPESGSEKVRRINKGFYYDNETFLKWMGYAMGEFVPIEIYFASGLSGETPENFNDTMRLAEKVIENGPVVSMSCNPIQLEPGGKWFEAPKKYGIIRKFTRFADFYDLFRKLSIGMNVESRLGYDTKWQKEEQILENSFRFDQIFSRAQPSYWTEILEGAKTLDFGKK